MVLVHIHDHQDLIFSYGTTVDKVFSPKYVISDVF